MNNSEFISFVQSRRSLRLADFTSAIIGEDQIGLMIDAVTRNNGRFSDQVKKRSGKNQSDSIPADEVVWKDFFKDHSFGSLENAKNFADMIHIMTGKNVNRYIVTPAPRPYKFPALVCLVPTGNSNSHSYDLGKPILNLQSGFRFFNAEGERGNDMSFEERDWRLATTEEISRTLIGLMYVSGGLAETFVVNLILSGEE